MEGRRSEKGFYVQASYFSEYTLLKNTQTHNVHTPKHTHFALFCTFFLLILYMCSISLLKVRYCPKLMRLISKAFAFFTATLN